MCKSVIQFYFIQQLPLFSVKKFDNFSLVYSIAHYFKDRLSFNVHVQVSSVDIVRKVPQVFNLLSYRAKMYLFIEEYMKLLREYMSNSCRK